MAKDIETINNFAEVSERERKELESYRRPIVLLKKKNPSSLPEIIAPGLHTVGVMLPYAGVHYILFYYSKTTAYVMTSANYSDLPMVKDNSEIDKISNLVDYFLIHNRRIVNRVDDSVIRFVNGNRAVIRRSRGFVPLPIEIPFSYQGIAMGAEMMNSFAIIKGKKVYPSQYIGNTSKVEVMDFQKNAIKRLISITELNDFPVILVDSHPYYNPSIEGKKLAGNNRTVVKVQHHFAHIASILAEKKISEIIGIAMDGVGYGLDKKIWGGEIILFAPPQLSRVSHISYFPLPGGDLATYYPLRALVGILHKKLGYECIINIIKQKYYQAIKHLPYGEREFEIILNQLEKRLNTPLTSSTGRVLDSIAVLLGIGYKRTYEGELAMKLESASQGGNDLNFKLSENGNIDISELFIDIINTQKKHKTTKDIAYSSHLAIARAFGNRAVKIAEQEGIKNIGVSGGVAYNDIIIKEINKIVKENGLRFFVTNEVPRGDNGISTGQAYIGGLYLSGEVKKEVIG